MTFIANGWGKVLEDPLKDPEEKPDSSQTFKVTGPGKMLFSFNISSSLLINVCDTYIHD